MKMNNIRKILSVGVLLILSLGLISGCNNGKDNNSKEKVDKQNIASNSNEQKFKIRIGADSSAFSYPFRVALEEGIFKKHNIDAEITTFSYGIDTLNALILDQVDIGEGMDFAIGTRIGENSNLKVISFIGSPTQKNAQLYVVGDDIKSPSDLTGKRIGVQKGTVNEYIWAQLFKKYNVDQSSVKMNYLQSDAELITAFNSGQLDALWVSNSQKDKISKIEGIKSLGDYSIIDFRMRGYTALKKDFIENNKEGIKQLLLALNEANEFIASNPEKTAEIAYKDLKTPKENALKDLANYEYKLRFSQDDFDHINSVIDWSIQNGLIKKKYDFKDYVDTSLLKEALPDSVTYDNK